MTMAVSCQLPIERGGAEGKCMYVDTEGTFRSGNRDCFDSEQNFLTLFFRKTSRCVREIWNDARGCSR